MENSSALNGRPSSSSSAVWDWVLGIKKLHTNAQLPKKNDSQDLGYDLFLPEDVELEPLAVTKIPIGIACKLPYGYGAIIADRSSISTSANKFVFKTAGVIDGNYSGEIIIAMYNPHKEYIKFNAGTKIAQMILTKIETFSVVEIDEIEHKGRGENGFGSSDIQTK